MRRVFTVAKKNRLSPYFLCMRWRVDKKSDYDKRLNSEDELLGSGRMATSSPVKATTSDRIVHQSCAPEPPDPVTCCGFGCANCVWIEYVTEVMRYYSGRPLHETLIEIDRVVPNVSVREFIKAEVRARVKRHH